MFEEPTDEYIDGMMDADGYCDCCGRSPTDNGHCPMCCDVGIYNPGSEECDWCGQCE